VGLPGHFTGHSFAEELPLGLSTGHGKGRYSSLRSLAFLSGAPLYRKTLRGETAVSCPFFTGSVRVTGNSTGTAATPLDAKFGNTYSLLSSQARSPFSLPSVLGVVSKALSVGAVQNLYYCLTELASVTFECLRGIRSGKYMTWRVSRAQYLFCTDSRHRAADSRSKSPRQAATRIDSSG
jgi:hypothetical protein